ncbi:MAG: glycosyltransferase [Pirellulales bacterium]
MLKTVYRNMFANWMGYLIQFVVTFFLTPLVVERLGESRYGIWIFCSSFTGYYGLLDLGLRGGITQYLARYFGQNRHDDVNKVLSSGTAALGLVGVATLVLSLILAWASRHFLQASPEYLNDAFWCVLIFGAAAAFQAAVAPYSSVLAAVQRYDVSNVIGITSRLLSAVLCVAVLWAGYGLIGLSLAVVAGNLVDYFARVVAAQWLCPFLKLSWTHVTRQTLRDIMSFGVWNFMIGLAQNIFEYADTFVIATAIGVAMVTPYALAARITGNATAMLASLRMVFFPAATQLHAREDWAGLRALYLSGTRSLLSCGWLVFALGWVWCVDFYRLWIDADAVSVETQQATPILFRILVICLVAQQVSAISLQVLLAMRQVRYVGLTVFVEALANVVLSFIWSVPWGLYGVAAATLVTSAIARILVIPYLANRQVNLSTWDFIRGAVWRPSLFGALLTLIGMGLRQLIPVTGWGYLLGEGIAMLVVAGLLGVLMVMTPAERQQLIVPRLPGRLRRHFAQSPSCPSVAPEPSTDCRYDVPKVLIVGPSLRIMGGQAVIVDRLMQAMRADGIRVDLQPINPEPPLGFRWMERIKFLRTVVLSTCYIHGLIRRVPQYDVIHIFSASYLSFIISQTPAILIARWYRKPIVLNYHSGQAEDHLKRWGRIVFAILRMTDRIVVQTPYLTGVFAQFGFRTVAIPNDIDTNAFPFVPRTQFRPDILVPRALDSLYNVGCAIRAFAIVQQAHADARLTILGTGPQRHELQGLVAQLKLYNVIFAGRVERSEVPDYYARHDIFVNSSSIDNMPVSILEAFSAGLPVVTTAAGGIPWMIKDRVTGHLVPLDDHRALAARILEVISEPKASAELAERAHAELDRYQWSQIGPQWYAIYRSLAAESSSARRSVSGSTDGPASIEVSTSVVESAPARQLLEPKV